MRGGIAHKVSVVLVSYNNQRVIFDCLASLRQTPGLSIYVVDNISSEEFLNELRREFPEIKLISNKENVGFSKANNQALRLVDTPYVLVLNSDTTVPVNTIPSLVEYLGEHPNVGVVGCRVELTNGRLDKACRRSFPTPWVAFTRYSFLDKIFPNSPLFARYNLTYKPEDETYEVDSLVGAFMLIRKKAMDEVGLFDEDYFMYGEDIDWCYRFWQKGWKIVYNPTVKIIHHKGASSGLKSHSSRLSPDKLTGRKRTLQAFYGAMRIFYRKHYRDKYPVWLTGVVLLAISLKYRLSLWGLYGQYWRDRLVMWRTLSVKEDPAS